MSQQIKEMLGIPNDFELVTVMAFGYPTDEVKGGGKRRKPLSQIPSISLICCRLAC